MEEFDEEIGNWCFENNISYTRYLDDMTFSGDFNSSLVIIKVKKDVIQVRSRIKL